MTARQCVWSEVHLVRSLGTVWPLAKSYGAGVSQALTNVPQYSVMW